MGAHRVPYAATASAGHLLDADTLAGEHVQRFVERRHLGRGSINEVLALAYPDALAVLNPI